MTFQSFSQFTATEFISFVTVEGIYTLGHWDIDGYLQLAEGSEDIIVVKNKDGEIIPVQDLCLLKTSTGILLIRSILEGPAGFHVTDVVDIWGRTFELYFHTVTSQPLESPVQYCKEFIVDNISYLFKFNATKVYTHDKYYIRLDNITFEPEEHSLNSFFSLLNPPRIEMVFNIITDDEIIPLCHTIDYFDHFINHSVAYVDARVIWNGPDESNFRNYPLAINFVIRKKHGRTYISDRMDMQPNLSAYRPDAPESLSFENFYQQNGQIKLSWEINNEENIDEYHIYKNKSPDFDIEDPFTETYSSSEAYFYDSNIQPLNRYYYKIKAIDNQGRQSAISREANIYIDVDFSEFVNLNTDITDDLVYLSGNILPALNSIEETSLFYNKDILIKSSFTDLSGNTQFTLLRPLIPGLYPVTIASSNGETTIKKDSWFVIPVNDAINYDVSVKRININTPIIYPDDPVELSFVAENHGEENISGMIAAITIRDIDNQMLYRENATISINAQDSTTLSRTITNAPTLPAELNYLEVELNPEIDFRTHNNLLKKPFFTFPSNSQITYKLIEELFIYDDGWMKNLYGYFIEVDTVLETSMDVYIDGDYYSMEYEKIYFIEEDMAITPVAYNSGDSSIQMRIGTLNTELNFRNVEAVNYRNNELRYRITHSSGIYLDQLFVFRYSMNSSELNGFDRFVDRINTTTTELVVILPDIDQDKDWNSWILHEDNNDNWWITSLYAHQRTEFDLEIQSVEIDNQDNADNLYLIGDELIVDAVIRNNSDYDLIDQWAEISLYREDTILFSKSFKFNISDNSNRSIQTGISSLGLEPGQYILKVNTPFLDDNQPGNNNYTQTIDIQMPPQLEIILDYVEQTGYVIDNEYEVKIVVNRNGEPVADAEVYAELTTSEKRFYRFECQYNSSEGYYYFVFKPRIGGRYKLDVKSSRKRSIGNTASIDFPVYSYLYLSTSDTATITGNTLILELSPQLVADINGIGFDVDYNPGKFQFLRYEKSNVFEQDGVTTQVMVQDQPGSLLIGYTRLLHGRGINIYPKTPLIRLYFKALEEGITQFEINDFAGVNSTGQTIEFIGVEQDARCEVTEIIPEAYLFQIKDSMQVHDTSTVFMNLLNAYNIGTVSGQISFNDTIIEILEIKKSRLINDDDLLTIFNVKDSVIDFGITKPNNGLLFDDYSANVLEITYKTLQHGFNEFRVKELACYDPDIILEQNAVTDTIHQNILSELDMPYGNIFFLPDSELINIDSSKVINICVSMVEDCYAFAGDLYYDSQHLSVTEITEGDFLKEQNISTSFLYYNDTQNGRITIGITRLGNVEGKTVPDTAVMLSLRINPVIIDTSNLVIINPVFIRPDNSSFSPNSVGNCTILSSDVIFQTMNIEFTDGWNIFSLAVAPGDIGMQAIIQPLIDEGSLIKVQDETGNAIENVFPIGWINDIGNWNYTEGYKIKVNANTDLVVTGVPVSLPADIDFITGWNIMGYPALALQDAEAAVADLISSGYLIKVQDEAGNAIENVFPIGWIDDIDNFDPGEGYKIKVNTDCILTINEPAGGMKFTAGKVSEVEKPTHFRTSWTGNGLDHMNVYITVADENGFSLQPGDELGIYDGNVCVGSGVIRNTDNGYHSLIASADDPTTGEMDGFTEGNIMTFKLWRKVSDVEINLGNVEYLPGYNGQFERMGTTTAKVHISISDGMFGITALGDNYPNPFTSETMIPFTIGTETEVDLAIYNLTGQRLKTLVSQTMQAGTYSYEWNRSDDQGKALLPGIYLCRMVAGNKVFNKMIEIY